MKAKAKTKAKRKKRSLKNKKNIKQINSDLKFVYAAAKAAEEKKGENILILDVSRLTVVSDYFLIVTAKSAPQVEAISKNIQEKLENLNYEIVAKEGLTSSNWVILDFGNLVVHVMHENERNYYKLERFWSNATPIDSKVWKKAS